MYATLRDNKLHTPGHDGEQFVSRRIKSPGVYRVRTCTQRGDVVEFGSGVVEVIKMDFFLANVAARCELNLKLPITDHKVVIRTPANYADYAQK